ncbi:MAG TPA: Ppx/GppA phosphatase family protein [Gemmatimonadaceae bacterium]|nr:Ppx/GppA phosphatase family protein [Gemmatimonadaceae bacterium]
MTAPPRPPDISAKGVTRQSSQLRLIRGPVQAGSAEEMRIAAIDIGSNSIRQIIADVAASGSIRVVDEMKAAPRLGAGVELTGKLSEAAMGNAVAALSRMATLARQLGSQRIEVVATSAVRDAENGKIFLDLVRKETGLRIAVLDGEDEARLSFRSAVAHFELSVGRAVIMDIGGGSLELALSADGLLERLISLPLGTIRLTEQFYRGANPRRALRQLRKHARRELSSELSAKDWHGAQLICSGGTFTNLAGIHLARRGMQSARTVHGTVVARVDLEHLVEVLNDMSPAERQQVPGLNAARADIIVAGLAVATEVLSRIEARELVVSAYGIREGLLLEAASITATPADRGEARQRSVRELAERSHYEEPHSKHVQKLALQIFDAIGTKLGCAPDDKSLLADAALLHDIGYHISYDKHHKHSYHLIQHAELLGMSPVEQIAVANIARYHRGAPPKKKHTNYGALDESLRDTILRLSAILRVADGFDRGHSSSVESVKIRWTQRAIRITAVPHPRAASLRLDLWGASRKSTLLSDVSGMPVEIVGPDGAVYTADDSEGSAD